MDHRPLGDGGHEHLLQAERVYRVDGLPQDCHLLLRHRMARPQLEFLAPLLCADHLRVVLRHREREHGDRAECRRVDLGRIGDPEVGVAAQELRLGGLDAGLGVRVELQARLRFELGEERLGEVRVVSLRVLERHRPGREVDHHGPRVLQAFAKPVRLLEREQGHLRAQAVVARGDHPHVLGEVVAHLVEGPLQLAEELRGLGRGAEVHWMGGVDVERALLVELRHLDVHQRVNLAGEVRVQERPVRRVLAADDSERFALELALDPLRADGAGQHADFHAVPAGRVARLEPVAGMRPEEHAEHPYGGVREEELVASSGGEADSADEVEPSVHHVVQALVVFAVDVVERPVRALGDRVEPLLYHARTLLAVPGDVEEAPAAVRRHAHAV